MDRVVTSSRVVAIVQARGGSKGIPHKNVQLLGRHPLIAYCIAAALGSPGVDDVMVSTDSSQIAEVARRYGARVPFLRPPEIAADDTPDLPVYQHALQWLDEKEGVKPDLIVQLRPTSPLIPRGLISRAIELLKRDSGADSVRSVTIAPATPFKMWRVDSNGYLDPLMKAEFSEPYNMPRQKLPTVFWQTGHVDVIRRSTIEVLSSMTGRTVVPVEIDRRYCVDIDSQGDLDRANWVFRNTDLDIVVPGTGRSARMLPPAIELVAFDFDGVFTDNRVLVSEDGSESVLCNRSDGLGLAALKKAGVPLVVISTEKNPVVGARCRKLGLESRQGIDDKRAALVEYARDRGINLSGVVYVGNDVNDLSCMEVCGFAVAVSDAVELVKAKADLVLTASGGHGAVRELCDLILRKAT
jgi:N-acylneuraminate cytidylyltransferase